ncbi:MAG: hypothetical protein CO119_11255 [Flavobacteriales bacterium CG_4_9_14_3_um_filter_40_17]|nr:MAG: hypothetical protein CO119_11255 [Flavobacteriales bacterium CG_4_9_14_3_um_filter_40_17]
MENAPTQWSKSELKVYILLLCAHADSVVSPDEINFIKSKTNAGIFEKIYKEFSADDEDTSLEKIETAIALHQYDLMEISALRKDMLEVFYSDKNFGMKERYLDRLLDNIIY